MFPSNTDNRHGVVGGIQKRSFGEHWACGKGLFHGEESYTKAMESCLEQGRAGGIAQVIFGSRGSERVKARNQ